MNRDFDQRLEKSWFDVLGSRGPGDVNSLVRVQLSPLLSVGDLVVTHFSNPDDGWVFSVVIEADEHQAILVYRRAWIRHDAYPNTREEALRLLEATRHDLLPILFPF